jgi:hypothetical protein
MTPSIAELKKAPIDQVQNFLLERILSGEFIVESATSLTGQQSGMRTSEVKGYLVNPQPSEIGPMPALAKVEVLGLYLPAEGSHHQDPHPTIKGSIKIDPFGAKSTEIPRSEWSGGLELYQATVALTRAGENKLREIADELRESAKNSAN